MIGDALDQTVLQDAVAQASAEEPVSMVAHLVGSIVIRPPHAMKMDQFNEVIATNLGSAFLTLSVCGKAMMRSGGGRMVFTSSVAAGLGLVNHEPSRPQGRPRSHGPLRSGHLRQAWSAHQRRRTFPDRDPVGRTHAALRGCPCGVRGHGAHRQDRPTRRGGHDDGMAA